jgi:hypothetical protein
MLLVPFFGVVADVVVVVVVVVVDVVDDVDGNDDDENEALPPRGCEGMQVHFS